MDSKPAVARGPMRRRLSGMPVNLGPAVKLALEKACPAVLENNFEVIALLAQVCHAMLLPPPHHTTYHAAVFWYQ